MLDSRLITGLLIAGDVVGGMDIGAAADNGCSNALWLVGDDGRDDFVRGGDGGLRFITDGKLFELFASLLVTPVCC